MRLLFIQMELISSMSVHLADVFSIQKSLLNYFCLWILNTKFLFYFNFFFSKYKSQKNETCVHLGHSYFQISFQKYKREWSFLLIHMESRVKKFQTNTPTWYDCLNLQISRCLKIHRKSPINRWLNLLWKMNRHW